MKHKHAELIKAWADGAEIEYEYDGEWIICLSNPAWQTNVEYRIKPEPKPDVVRYLMTNDYECGNLKLYEDRLFVRPQSDDFDNLYEQIKIVRDSFGKLKHVEIYK